MLRRSKRALDIADPEHPREVSRVTFGDDEEPHWLAIDPSGRRLVLNSAGYKKSNRLFVINFDPASGALSIDDRFRDPADTRPGIDLTGKTWPHGFNGQASPARHRVLEVSKADADHVRASRTKRPRAAERLVRASP